MSTTHSTPRLVRACRRELLDRPPVWLMRQAGRYMPEYRAMREKYSFLELCHTPSAAVEVSLQPYHAFGMDAVIMFSDILIPPEAMGMEVVFGDSGPTFPNPIRSAADVDRLIIPDPVEKTGFVMEILRQLRRELASDQETALIGFAGAPWTLASYMIEGGGSKHFAKIKGMMVERPELLHRLLDKLADTVILYLNAQIAAGAHAVQLFDSWGGILSEEEARRFILPYHQKIIGSLNRGSLSGQPPEASFADHGTGNVFSPNAPYTANSAQGSTECVDQDVQDLVGSLERAGQDGPQQTNGAAVILYINNSRGLLPLMAEAGPDVISVDPLTSLAGARDIVGPGFALQGNLEPTALFVSPETLKPLVQSMVAEGQSVTGGRGYIFNLGHGILPPTPVENVRLLIDTVKESARFHVTTP